MNENDVDTLFTSNGRDVWRMVWYCSEPSACLENVETKKRTNGAIGCRNLAGFKRLKTEEQAQ